MIVLRVSHVEFYNAKDFQRHVQQVHVSSLAPDVSILITRPCPFFSSTTKYLVCNSNNKHTQTDCFQLKHFTTFQKEIYPAIQL